MANNVSITPGAGDVVAAEEVSSVKYQKIKLVDATAASTNPTGVAANPLQVSLANTGANATSVKVDGTGGSFPVTDSGGSLTVDGTVAVTNAGITSIDGKITACNTGAVVVSSGAITETNSGTIASDTTSIDGKITACNTGAVVLAGGTALVGKVGIDQVTANANEVVVKSGTVTAVTSITNAVAVTNADLSTIAGDTTSIDGKITACNTGAVVLAAGTALAGKFGIDQSTANANEVVVKSGTVTAVTSITNAVAVTNADVSTIAGAVAGTEMQVDVVSMPTTTVQATNLDIRDLTSAADSVAAVCTNAGTFAVQATLSAETTKVIGTVNVASSQTIAVTQATASSLKCEEASASAIKTAVEAIDNAVDGNYLNCNLNIAGTDVDGNSGNKSAQTMRVVLATDQPQLSNKLLVTADGTVNTTSGKTLLSYTGSINATTDVVAADGSKKIYVVAYSLITAATTANVLTFQSNASTALWTLALQAITGTIAGANLSIPPPSFLFATAAGEKLTLNFSSGQTTYVNLTYYKE